MHGLIFGQKKSLLKKEVAYFNIGLNSKILGQVQGPRSPPPYEGLEKQIERKGEGLGTTWRRDGETEREWMKDGKEEAVNERRIDWDRGWKDGGVSWITSNRLVPEIFSSSGTEVQLKSNGAPSSQTVVAFISYSLTWYEQAGMILSQGWLTWK